MDVSGKVALVTGAASGIGLTYVRELLKNDVKGVLLADINFVVAENELKKLRQEFGSSKIFCIEANVCDHKQLEGTFNTAIKIFNQLDIVINNAGIIDETQWEKCCYINLMASIAGTKLAVEKYLPKYKSSDDAIVIITSSILGLEPSEECPVYSATKFGILGYVRAMGGNLRYQTDKIRVIGICPGRTATTIRNVSLLQVPEPFNTKFNEFFCAAPNQPPESVARHVVNLIRSAPTGSMWKIVNDECEQVEFLKYEI